MTPTVEELRRWSAELMGWHATSHNNPTNRGEICLVWTDPNRHWSIDRDNWHPDTDLNQTFMVVEKMREMGWYLYILSINLWPDRRYHAEFSKAWGQQKTEDEFDAINNNLAHAILLAAYRAVEEDNDG